MNTSPANQIHIYTHSLPTSCITHFPLHFYQTCLDFNFVLYPTVLDCNVMLRECCLVSILRKKERVRVIAQIFAYGVRFLQFARACSSTIVNHSHPETCMFGKGLYSLVFNMTRRPTCRFSSLALIGTSNVLMTRSQGIVTAHT